MSVQAPGSKGGGISGALTGRHLDVRHLVAGTGAGAVSTAALFPLDLIKTRFQVHNGHLEGDRYLRIPRYRSLGDAARRIFGTEGFRGFYQGLSPALIGASASWGLYFFFYENAKTRRQVQAGVAGEGHSKLPTSQHLLSACEAGVITTLCTNPIWLVKTRLQLQVRTVPMPDGSQMTQNYRGFWDALTSVVRNEGPLALYRGIVPALLLVSHGAIQFTVYEELKRRIGVAKGDQRAHHTLAMASASKLVASTATYPYQVVKARLQARGAEARYRGFIDCVVRTWRGEGIHGFFRGLTPNVVRVVPSSAITFLAYETIMQGLGNSA